MNPKRGLWFVASTAIHIVLVLLLLQAMLAPRAFIALFTRAEEPVRPERLTYVVPVQPPPLQVPPPRIAIPNVQPPVEPVPVPPRNVPSTLPPIPAGAAATIDTGATRGGPPSGTPPLPTLNPTNPDPKLLSGNIKIVESPPATGVDAIRSSLDSTLKARKDSLARIPNPYDWTVGDGDKKYGIDPNWIYLGRIKIPSAVLGLIPLKVQANPQLADRNRTLGAMAAEVREKGPLAKSRGDEIRNVNARMQRERNARVAAAASGSDKKPPPD